MTILAATANMSLFSENMPDEETKNMCGWWMVYYISFGILINFILVIKVGLRSIYLMNVKYCRLLERFIKKKMEEMSTVKINNTVKIE